MGSTLGPNSGPRAGVILAHPNSFPSRNLYGRYPKDSKFQNSEYEVHQVDPKDYGSQSFSFLAFMGTELVSRQIFAMATTTARDRRKFFYRSNHVF
jgi:hypothetical protein